MNVHDWIEKNKKESDNKPKIQDFKDDILLLKDKGFTNKDVKRYLEEVKNYKISEVYISKYIRKTRGITDETKDKKTQTVSSETKKDIQETKKAQMENFFNKAK